MKEAYWLICPDYPPSQSGLAGHTHEFACALRKVAVVRVLTSKDETRTGNDLFPVVAAWGFLGLLATYLRTPELRARDGSRIVIQYLPFLYNPRGGINFGICFFALFLRLRRHKVDLICHELHYPLLPNLKASILFSAHVLMLLLISLAASRVFTTTEFFAARAQKLLLWRRRITVLPVGSNLEPQDEAAEAIAAFRRREGLEGKFVISCFGTLHPTREMRAVLKAILDWQESSKTPSALLLLGESAERMRGELGDKDFSRLLRFAVILGKVNEPLFSLAMGASHVAVAYFSDGASTRRGSLMASLAHGVPTISTVNERTEMVLRNLAEIILLPTELGKFSSTLAERLSHLALTSPPAKRKASPEYQAHFSWDRIVARFREAKE